MSLNSIYYVVGPSRSGSSFFEETLSKNKNYDALGELRWFFERGCVDNDMCSCNNLFNECNFWSEIKNIFTKNDFKIAKENRIYFDNPVNVLPLFFPIFQTKNWKSNWRVYSKLLQKLYYKIFSKSNKVIIDNSKSPFYLIVLYFIFKNKIEIIPIFFNRNIKGVVNSYAKNKIRVETQTKELMRKRSFFHAIIYYVAVNWIAKLILTILKFKSKFYVHYQDICLNQSIVLKSFPFNNTNNTILKHSISGNPDRITSGFKKIKFYDNKDLFNNKCKNILLTIVHIFTFNKTSVK